jgi:hypothetical protein
MWGDPWADFFRGFTRNGTLGLLTQLPANLFIRELDGQCSRPTSGCISTVLVGKPKLIHLQDLGVIKCFDFKQILKRL